MLVRRTQGVASALALSLLVGAASCERPALDACRGKLCGEPCQRTDGSASLYPTFCSEGGACSPLATSCGRVEPCVTELDCPPSFGGLAMCQDGTLVPGESLCFYGTCWTDVPPCPCRPQLALGVGECAALVGWRFTGSDCEGVAGCLCVGPDCVEVFATEQACATFYKSCIEA